MNHVTHDHNSVINDRRDQIDKDKSTGRLIDFGISQTKSDSESGFDESCSNMSRSGIDECKLAGLEGDVISRSGSQERLNLDQLHLELDSVAVDWRSFRNIFTCSCAFPFDHFTKKARNKFHHSFCVKSMVLFKNMFMGTI